MHRCKPVSTSVLAATLAVVAVLGGCKRDSLGPGVESKDFAAALRSVSGDQQIGSVGAALTQQLTVKVVDAGGVAVQGATVTFQVRAGGGNVNPPANASGPDGLVNAVWTLGTTLGVNKVVAILTTNFLADSATFTATAIAGPPSAIILVSGDKQQGRVGNPLAQPLIVRVQDQYGFVKSGVKVMWAPGASSGTIAPVTDTTVADGTVSAIWTLGTLNTPQSMGASVTGVTTPVVFTATTLPDTGRQLVPAGGAGQVAPVGSTLPVQLKVKVTDQFGNLIAGETIKWTDSLTGGGSVSAATGVTGADGTAQVAWTLGNRAGVQLLRAKALSNGSTGNFTATATVAFSDVKAGNFQACGVIASNNRTYCWGLNDAGQLGKGSLLGTTAPTTPVAASGDSVNGPFIPFRQLTGGRSFFCGLTPGRQIYCWGNVFNSAPSNVAVVVSLPNNFANLLAAGEDHDCLISIGGVAYCAGGNEQGQLGDGTFVNHTDYQQIFPGNGLLLWSNIVSGRTHTCAMPRYDGSTVATQRASRTPSCWGLNNSGQIGDGTTLRKNAQTAVVMPTPGTVFDSTGLTAGGAHTCAMTPVDSGGAGWCWGGNGFGQLGNGAVDNKAHPNPMAVAMPAGVIFATVAAGEFHTCAIDNMTGDAWCWGRNDLGQLGDGTTNNSSIPVKVGGGLHFRSISLGELYTCGIVAPLGTPVGPSSQAGTVYCWGDNVFGQIGNGQASGGNAPVLAPTKVLYQP
jgi:alpha-tubulin suppressor-like RCC1 family protein